MAYYPFIKNNHNNTAITGRLIQLRNRSHHQLCHWP